MSFLCELCGECYNEEDAIKFRCCHHIHKACPFLESASVDWGSQHRDASCHDCLPLCRMYFSKGLCNRIDCKFNHDVIAGTIMKSTGTWMQRWHPKKGILSLREEIVAFSKAAQHTWNQQKCQVKAIRSYLARHIARFRSDAWVLMHGSRNYGVSLPNADIDFQLIGLANQPWEAEAQVNDVLAAIQCTRNVQNFKVITTTFWPMLKFEFVKPTFEIDLSICSYQIFRKCEERETMLFQLGQQRKAFFPLLLILKRFIKRRFSQEDSLPSICLAIMVAAYLQNVADGEIDFAELLLGFLEFHGTLDDRNRAISMSSCYPVTFHGEDIFVQDPLECTVAQNLARDRGNIATLWCEFQTAWQILSAGGSLITMLA